MRNRVQLTGDIFFRFVIDVSFNDADDDDNDDDVDDDNVDDNVDDVIAGFTTASASTEDTSLLRGILIIICTDVPLRHP